MNPEAIWRSMEERNSAEGLSRQRIRTDSHQDLFLAYDHASSRRSLLLEVSSGDIPDEVSTFRTRGVNLQRIETEDGHILLKLELASDFLAEVFSNLVRDVVPYIAAEADKRSGAQALLRRLQEWKSLLDQERITSLSLERQRGLFGELLFLESHALQALDQRSAVLAWRGPYQEIHDFLTATVEVEVKTGLTSDEISSFKVCGEQQLNSRDGRQIFVYFVKLAAVPSGDGTSLPDLVGELRARFSCSPDVKALFERALERAGYFDVHSSQYNQHLRVDDTVCFEVRPGFPKLSTEVVPEGIHHIQYRVRVSACAPFSVTRAVLEETLSGGHSGG